MARKISTTALAFEIKNKFIAHREGRLDTQSLNFEICRYMYTYNKIIIIDGDFHSQMYNILGKKRLAYMKSIYELEQPF